MKKEIFKKILLSIILIVLLLITIVFLNYKEYKNEESAILSILYEEPELDRKVYISKSLGDNLYKYENLNRLYSSNELNRILENKDYKDSKIYILEYTNKKVVKYKGDFIFEVDEDNKDWILSIYQTKVYLDIAMILVTILILPLLVVLINKFRGIWINGNIQLSKIKLYDIIIVSTILSYFLLKCIAVFSAVLDSFSTKLYIPYAILFGVLYVLLNLREEYIINSNNHKNNKKLKEIEFKKKNEREAKKEAKKESKKQIKEKSKSKNIEVKKSKSFEELTEKELEEFALSYKKFREDGNVTKVNQLEKEVQSHLDKLQIDKDLNEFIELASKGELVYKDGNYYRKNDLDKK